MTLFKGIRSFYCHCKKNTMTLKQPCNIVTTSVPTYNTWCSITNHCNHVSLFNSHSYYMDVVSMKLASRAFHTATCGVVSPLEQLGAVFPAVYVGSDLGSHPRCLLFLAQQTSRGRSYKYPGQPICFSAWCAFFSSGAELMHNTTDVILHLTSTLTAKRCW